MLPRLTPKQRQRANALIKRLCANYDNGNCLALDDGEPCACVQSISYSLLCNVVEGHHLRALAGFGIHMLLNGDKFHT